MPKFPTEEWANQYVQKLNNNASYKVSGKNWEGSITFVIEHDNGLNQDAFLYLDLFHGECKNYIFSFQKEILPQSEFKYVGKYLNWLKLIDGKIDPIHGILTGKFKLEGSMFKIMKFTKAAKEMVSTASLVPKE
jgi:putative sterol carrier protein